MNITEYRERERGYKAKHREKNATYARKRGNSRRQMLNIIKMEVGCSHCGYDECAAALSFHHRDPLTKLKGVGSMMLDSIAAIQAEINKCVVLCSNCHMELEYGEGR